VGGGLGACVGEAACVGDGAEVAVGASVAEAGRVGGTSVGGGPGDAVLTARRPGVGVPSIVMLVEGRLTKKKITAAATTSKPRTSATHGQRLDGSPG
jgi:hypothetical protein